MASDIFSSPARKFLNESSWVAELSEDARERVFSDVREQIVEAGGIVASKGNSAASWIGVAEGLLKISSVYRTGKVVMFSGIPEGSWVGEGSVVKRELRRYDIVAMRLSRVLHLPASTFRFLLDTSIEFNHAIISRLNERLAQYIGMMEIDRLSDPIARVARTIATLYNPVLNPHMSPILPLSQTELGELIGMSRQSVSAALKQLEDKGLLKAGYGGLIVLKLQSLANYQELS
ncbi:Crp/Fnr family transcriptional regulator [uncultured Xylophilus sp.]|uniref:Crp/Fnr family transcriptional regulator n=1 Tax=uncultured Xylophilus sp. TaxID=296832 RepID=UPI0025E3DBF2|nr:Crp/Fnr family transcriptional regulator [uncultured Xylophilus sp.]